MKWNKCTHRNSFKEKKMFYEIFNERWHNTEAKETNSWISKSKKFWKKIKWNFVSRQFWLSALCALSPCRFSCFIFFNNSIFIHLSNVFNTVSTHTRMKSILPSSVVRSFVLSFIHLLTCVTEVLMWLLLIKKQAEKKTETNKLQAYRNRCFNSISFFFFTWFMEK